MTPRPASAKMRRECFEAHKHVDADGRIYLICHICLGRIDPATERWEADHVIRRVLSGDDTISNLWPAHYKCHRIKTSDDVTENAKGKRVSDKNYGIVEKTGFRSVGKYNWKTGRYERVE